MSNGNGNVNGNGSGKPKRIVEIHKIEVPVCVYCNQPADWVLIDNNDDAIAVCDFHKTNVYGYSA